MCDSFCFLTIMMRLLMILIWFNFFSFVIRLKIKRTIQIWQFFHFFFIAIESFWIREIIRRFSNYYQYHIRIHFSSFDTSNENVDLIDRFVWTIFHSLNQKRWFIRTSFNFSHLFVFNYFFHYLSKHRIQFFHHQKKKFINKMNWQNHQSTKIKIKHFRRKIYRQRCNHLW